MWYTCIKITNLYSIIIQIVNVIEKVDSDCTLIKGMNLMHFSYLLHSFCFCCCQSETGSLYFSVLQFAIQ